MSVRLYRHPKVLMLVATALAVAGVAVVSLSASWAQLTRAWTDLAPLWLILVIAGSAAAIVAYVVTYAGLIEAGTGPRLPTALIGRIVAVGFGPFVPGGGFSIDRQALSSLQKDESSARAKVSSIGLFELAVLTPPVGGAALWLLLDGVPAKIASGLTPWVYGVPIGFAVVIASMVWVRWADPDPQLTGWRGALVRIPLGGCALLDLIRTPRAGALAVGGMAAYWLFDVAAFEASLRFVGASLDLRLMLVAYGTGYALTRRSMPLGGAGITEILLVVSVHWVGISVARSTAAVIVYRAFNFLAPAVPALLARADVEPLIEGDASAISENPLYESAEEAVVEEDDSVR